MARKKKSKPTSKRRHAKQNLKDRYAHAREDAQLSGLIPTTPEEALKSERVDPSTQDEQRFPGLDRLAIAADGKGWSVPEHVKRKVVEVNAEVLFEKRVVYNDRGEAVEVPPNRFEQQRASKVLLLADQKQYERDNPEEAGKARGGAQVNQQTNVVVGMGVGELLTKVQEQRECKVVEEQIEHIEESKNGVPRSAAGDGEEEQNEVGDDGGDPPR